MRHEGALSIHANGELLLQLNADGSVEVGPQFAENAPLVFRTLALKYPRWAGELISSYARAFPVDRTVRVAVASAAGGPVAADLATRLARAVLEAVAVTAEEQGVAGEAAEASRQAELQRKQEAEQPVTMAVGDTQGTATLDHGPNGADAAPG